MSLLSLLSDTTYLTIHTTITTTILVTHTGGTPTETMTTELPGVITHPLQNPLRPTNIIQGIPTVTMTLPSGQTVDPAKPNKDIGLWNKGGKEGVIGGSLITALVIFLSVYYYVRYVMNRKKKVVEEYELVEGVEDLERGGRSTLP